MQTCETLRLRFNDENSTMETNLQHGSTRNQVLRREKYPCAFFPSSVWNLPTALLTPRKKNSAREKKRAKHFFFFQFVTALKNEQNQ